MAFRMKVNKSPNINRVVIKVVTTVLALYVGGFVLTEIGNVMNSSCSPFYKGLSLIGWEIGTATCETTGVSDVNTITSTSGSGVLAVVGIVAIASIVTEFVYIQM